MTAPAPAPSLESLFHHPGPDCVMVDGKDAHPLCVVLREVAALRAQVDCGEETCAWVGGNCNRHWRALTEENGEAFVALKSRAEALEAALLKADTAVLRAQYAVEEAGASEALTRATVALMEARAALAKKDGP